MFQGILRVYSPLFICGDLLLIYICMPSPAVKCLDMQRMLDDGSHGLQRPVTWHRRVMLTLY